jgi:hypothetical protein
MSRLVCNFSCGAASAVAAKIALTEYPGREVLILNAYIEEEHPDNQRFLEDCQRWFGHPVQQVRDEKYGASTREVFTRKRFITGLGGAPCSKALKRDVLSPHHRPTDTIVLGYTAEEEHRLERFLDANNGVQTLTPLIERGLRKADCLAIIERAGIKLPAMYALGYQNNNCIGCVKGGMGYWNKIRRDFPERFEEIARIQDAIGPKAAFLKLNENGVKNSRYVSLRELPPDIGRYQDEPSISCGLFCEAASNDIGGPEVHAEGGER